MPEHAPLILVVEDEEDMLRGLQHNLEFEGYRVLTAADGKEGLDKALQGLADLIVLDVMLPHVNGFDILRRVRGRKIGTPVILLTSKSLQSDKLEGFRLGADDYVTKPFSIEELLARVQAILQRTAPARHAEGDGCESFGELEVDFRQRTARLRERPLGLALKEFELLQLLVENRGEIVSRDRMLQEVWGYHPDNFPETRTVDNHIAKLRQKIGAHFIETVPKRGYRFRSPDAGGR